MSDEQTGPTRQIRRSTDTTPEQVSAGNGLSKAVLFDESLGADAVALRRFTLDSGGTVPEHTNAVEHVQYVLAGEYVVGIDDTEYTVREGDAIHVPAGTVHWYRNDSAETVAFLCAVPTGDDTIELVDGDG